MQIHGTLEDDHIKAISAFTISLIDPNTYEVDKCSTEGINGNIIGLEGPNSWGMNEGSSIGVVESWLDIVVSDTFYEDLVMHLADILIVGINTISRFHC